MKKNAPFARGYVQVYTGNGKGKTTAALGLALRAAGAGCRVCIIQFAKGLETSEQISLRRLQPQVVLKHYGMPRFIMGNPTPEDIAEAHRGLAEAERILKSGEYDLVILDEANVAVHLELFSIDELMALLEARPMCVEVVVTGRDAHARLLEKADLVTNMAEGKHYYEQGVAARRGIES